MPEPRPAVAPAVVLLFLSGAAALIYETVWLRMLSRTFGITVHAMAALVALYMAGLALGAAGGARMSWKGSWLRLYAWLEAGAGLAALLGTWWLLKLPGIVASLSAEAPLCASWRLLLAAPALLPATALLGATLPALTRHCGSPGRLYAANTAGAMAGLAVAAFWTIGLWGETATVALAAACNAAAAVGAYVLSRGPLPSRERPSEAPQPAAPPTLILGLFALSGFCALGYEILWSRQLVALLGNSTYAFAALLIVYLGGIGLGSSLQLEPETSPRETFGLLLTALGCAAVWSLVSYRLLGLGLDSPDFLYSPLRRFGDFPLLCLEAVVVVLPVSFLLGLIFPAAVRACAGSAEEGAVVGRLYAWNTVGGIAGSLWAGFFGVAWLGAHKSFMLLAGLQIAAGLAALAGCRGRRLAAPAVLVGLSLLGAVYAWRDPALEMLSRRLRRGGVPRHEVLFHDESAAASVTGISYADQGGEARSLLINGIITSDKGSVGALMVLLPSLFAEDPRASLVICFGAGNTFRAASLLGGDVDAVELVADVVRRMPYFQDDAAEHLGRAGRRIFIEDGRNYLLRTRRRYDVMVVDASPPLYSAGTVNLYSKEFMALARARLTQGGVFALWLPSLGFESDYWQILRGMSEVFEHVAVWGERPRLTGFLAFGSPRPLAWAPGVLTRRIRTRLRGLPFENIEEAYVRSGLRLSEAQIRAFAGRFPPVTDDRPSVEFPLPRFWRGEPLVESMAFLKSAR